MRGHRHAVLVVEDDGDSRDALQAILTAHGLEVFCARDGQEALQMLQGGLRPCLIVLDLRMPRMTGGEFRRQQQDDPQLAAIPVAVLSGIYGLDGHAHALGIPDYMKKPVDVARLVSLALPFGRPRTDRSNLSGVLRAAARKIVGREVVNPPP